ncbi:MAG: hypothetical protein JRF37_07330 [Deltaproteobacteria bacterium]|nr:hypothetical protein [Deltaproteobacteria bacterium]
MLYPQIMEERAIESNKWCFDGLERPWLRRQVETHLVFGPISRTVSFAWLVLCCGIAAVFYTLFSTDMFSGLKIGQIVDKLIFVIVPILLLKFPKFQQAAIGWIVTKFSLGLIALLFMTVASLLSLVKGQSDALPNFLVGVIWLPGFEFIPAVTRKQRYLSLARIILSIPVVYLGIQSGHWRW